MSCDAFIKIGIRLNSILGSQNRAVDSTEVGAICNKNTPSELKHLDRSRWIGLK